MLKLLVILGAAAVAGIVLFASIPSLAPMTFGGPAPTPDTSIIPVTRDHLLMYCLGPDDCGTGAFIVPAGSSVKLLNRETGYVRVIDINRTASCEDAARGFRVAQPTALCATAGDYGLMSLN